MSEEQKYTPIQVIKEIVDTLKPKIEADIEDLAKAAPLFSGSGAQQAKGFGSIISGGTPPPVRKYEGGLKKQQMEKKENAGSLSVDHFPTGHMHRGNKIVSVMHDHDTKMIHVRTEHGSMPNQTKTHSYDIKNPPKHAFDTKKA